MRWKRETKSLIYKYICISTLTLKEKGGFSFDNYMSVSFFYSSSLSRLPISIFALQLCKGSLLFTFEYTTLSNNCVFLLYIFDLHLPSPLSSRVITSPTTHTHTYRLSQALSWPWPFPHFLLSSLSLLHISYPHNPNSKSHCSHVTPSIPPILLLWKAHR